MCNISKSEIEARMIDHQDPDSVMHDKQRPEIFLRFDKWFKWRQQTGKSCHFWEMITNTGIQQLIPQLSSTQIKKHMKVQFINQTPQISVH